MMGALKSIGVSYRTRQICFFPKDRRGKRDVRSFAALRMTLGAVFRMTWEAVIQDGKWGSIKDVNWVVSK